MRALFHSRNLLGDGMNIYPAIKTWWNAHNGLYHGDWEIDLYTLPEPLKVIYQRMGIPMNVITRDEDRRDPYDFEFEFNCNEAFKLGDINKEHIALAYCRMLKVQVRDEDWKLRFDTDWNLEEHEKNLVLISPFSKSCSSQQGFSPNKMLQWCDWKPILRVLRRLGPIGVLGASGDRAPELEIPEEEYYTGLPLEKVAAMLKASKLVVTIDNGISHLAASQLSKMILFYPACLGQHWITPIGNPNLLLVVQLDPMTVEAGELVLAIKQRVLDNNL